MRYFALRDLLGRPTDDPDVVAAQAEVMRTGPVPAILAAQAPEGYWVQPGPGYGPKYRSTVWSVLFLAQLGADGRDPRVRRGIEHLLDHALTKAGAFSCVAHRATRITACGAICAGDARPRRVCAMRLARAVEALARSVTGMGTTTQSPACRAPAFLLR